MCHIYFNKLGDFLVQPSIYPFEALPASLWCCWTLCGATISCLSLVDLVSGLGSMWGRGKNIPWKHCLLHTLSGCINWLDVPLNDTKTASAIEVLSHPFCDPIFHLNAFSKHWWEMPISIILLRLKIVSFLTLWLFLQWLAMTHLWRIIFLINILRVVCKGGQIQKSAINAWFFLLIYPFSV